MIKLLVEIALDKPILRGSKIRLEEELVWVDFRYENLPAFCFYCGRIGHPERSCEHKMEDSKNNCIVEGQYGGWLRVQPVKGSKIETGTKGGSFEKLGNSSAQIEGRVVSNPLKTNEGGELVLSNTLVNRGGVCTSPAETSKEVVERKGVARQGEQVIKVGDIPGRDREVAEDSREMRRALIAAGEGQKNKTEDTVICELQVSNMEAETTNQYRDGTRLPLGALD